MAKLLVLAGLLLALAPAARAEPLPPQNAPYPKIAAYILRQVTESKGGATIRCLDLAGAGPSKTGRLHAAQVRSGTLAVSMDHVCWPLAEMWGDQPIFTGDARDALPFAAVDAVEILAHAWFASRGATDAAAECSAARATWKWLRRSALSPRFKTSARKRLLDNGRRPKQYAIAASCVPA